MLIEIDFNSEEAIYIQLRNQVILGIATANIHEGDFTLQCVSLQKRLALICIR